MKTPIAGLYLVGAGTTIRPGIEDVISSIQGEVSAVKIANESVTQNVNDGLEVSKEVRNNMVEIEASITKSDTRLKEVAEDIAEQSAASAEIITAISNITDSSSHIEEKTTGTYKTLEKITEVLGRKAKDLDSLFEVITQLKSDIEFFDVAEENN